MLNNTQPWTRSVLMSNRQGESRLLVWCSLLPEHFTFTRPQAAELSVRLTVSCLSLSSSGRAFCQTGRRPSGKVMRLSPMLWPPEGQQGLAGRGHPESPLLARGLELSRTRESVCVCAACPPSYRFIAIVKVTRIFVFICALWNVNHIHVLLSERRRS